MTIGDVVKQYRKENGISMNEFAKRSALSKGYISMLENNVNPRNKKAIAPTLPSVKKIATAMGMELDELLSIVDKDQEISLAQKSTPSMSSRKSISIPVYGRVAAGIPLEMIDDIIDFEEIPEDMAALGEYFALQIHGDSMEPRMKEGDVVIVRQQEDAETGEIVIVTVNGTDAACKRLKKYRDGIELISTNPSYETIFFSEEEIVEKPVRILGKVVELRAKF